MTNELMRWSDTLRDPEAVYEPETTFEAVFRRSLASILASLGINTNMSAFETIVQLAEQHMETVFARLHKITQIQRRQDATVSDLRIMMDSLGITITGLEREHRMHTHYTSLLNNLKVEGVQDMTSDEIIFNSQPTSKLQSLMGTNNNNNKKTPAYVHRGMPAFPPDHTFKFTPVYSQVIREPRQLRELIVQEGQLAESALRRLERLMNPEGLDQVGAKALAIEAEVIPQLEPPVATISTTSHEPGSLTDELVMHKPEQDPAVSPAEKLDTIDDNLKQTLTPQNTLQSTQRDGADSTQVEVGTAAVKQEEPKEPAKPLKISIKAKPSYNDEAAVSRQGQTSTPPSSQPTEPTTTTKSFSLKLTFGKKKAEPTNDNVSESLISNNSNYNSNCKRFDIVEYVKQRQNIVEKRRAKELEREARKQSRLSVQQDLLVSSEQELIQREYKKALAKAAELVAKSPTPQQHRPVLGNVRWDQSRYDA